MANKRERTKKEIVQPILYQLYVWTCKSHKNFGEYETNFGYRPLYKISKTNSEDFSFRVFSR